jgi:hypothetical protein
MKGFRGTRLRTAVAMAVCLVAILAFPALAYAATFANQSPAGTLDSQPAIVGVNVFSATALDTRDAVITIDGTAYHTYVIAQGSVLGQWIQGEALQPDGTYRIHWTWVDAAADSTMATVYCYAPTLRDGTHDVTATVAGQSAGWSFTLRARPVFGAPTPANGATVNTTSPAIFIPVTVNDPQFRLSDDQWGIGERYGRQPDRDQRALGRPDEQREHHGRRLSAR